jgi:uncharacterized protein YbjT (DUF2867 family)
VILVTGATGFVGSHVVAGLRAAGYPVRVLVRSERRAAPLKALGCEVAVGDLADAQSVERAVAGSEVVVHLVAIIVGDPGDFRRVMVEGTRVLVEAAKRAGVWRFVLMSALGVSEQTKDLVPYYGAKWAMEQMVEGSGLAYVIFRPSFILGRDGGALPLFARVVRYSPVTPVMGKGTQRIQPIDVDDVAAFFVKAIDLPEAVNRTFELGGPDILTWNEFWVRLQQALGKRRPRLHVPSRLARIPATLLERLPSPPLTRDQLTMLEAGDNTCDPEPAARTFGIELKTLDEQLRRSL